MIGPKLTTKHGLAVMKTFGEPQALAKAGKARLLKTITRANPRRPKN